jgi:hypothetical protein
LKHLHYVLLLVATFNVSALDINPELSGSWYNPAQDGHGLNVATLNEDLTLVYWYVYHTDGTPMFLITVGTNQGDSTSGTTYYNTGMKFGAFDPDDREQTIWGSSTVTFHDCYSATLEYTSDDPAYGSGSIPMQRLTFVSGIKCSESALHGTFHASWAANGEVGFGVATLFENGDMAFGAASDTTAEIGLGQWWETGTNTFSFEANSFVDTGEVEIITGSGTFGADGLTASYTGNGLLVATPVPSFQYDLSTQMMAGTYVVQDIWGTNVGDASVLSDGTVTGSTLDGCDFDGSFSVPDTLFNQAYLILDVTNCGLTTGIIGSATYNNNQNTISVLASDGFVGYYWLLQ